MLPCSVNVTDSASEPFSSMFKHLQRVFIQIWLVIYIQQSENQQDTSENTERLYTEYIRKMASFIDRPTDRPTKGDKLK